MDASEERIRKFNKRFQREKTALNYQIDEFIHQNLKNLTIETKHLEEMILFLMSRTGASHEVCRYFLELVFHEMRVALLQGYDVKIGRTGVKIRLSKKRNMIYGKLQRSLKEELDRKRIAEAKIRDSGSKL